jgi:putative ABC transport system permease protein
MINAIASAARALLSRVRGLFAARDLDSDFAQELESHLELLIDENIRRGMSRAEAARAARLKLGGNAQLRESHHDQSSLPWLESLSQDIRFALRMLRKNLGFTAVAVLTLALGIGASTAIFSVVYGIVFRPLPYHDPARLVSVSTRFANELGSDSAVSMPDFKDWQSQNTVFESLAGYGYNRYDLTDEQGGDSVRAAMVSPEFFSMLGVPPLLGRELGPQDDRERVAVLGYELWQQVFHGDRYVIGKSLRLRNSDFEIVGVMPPSFRLPTPDVSFWLSLSDIYATSGTAGVGNWIGNRGLRGYRVIARLRDQVSAPAAEAQMNALESRLAETYPQDDKGLGIHVVPLQARIVGGVADALFLFLGAVGFVLVIACVNVANLLLARATVRQREMAVRHALGARTSRLIRQMLTESALLGTIGAAFGILLAFWSVKIFLGIIPQSVPRLQEVHVDGYAMLFALVLALFASMFFGLAPAFRVRNNASLAVLREGRRGAGGGGSSRMRGVLVSGEIAAATILVAGAALMLQSFVRLATLRPGFPPDHLLTIAVSAPLDRHPQAWQQNAFFNQVLAKIRTLPGVTSAGACSSMPPGIVQESDAFMLPGRTPDDASKSPIAWYLPATPGFAETLGLPLVAGRNISESDVATSPQVAVINQKIRNEYFRDESPIGQRLKFNGVDRTIIGVVGDTTYSGLGVPADFQIYVPYAQATFPGLHFAIRTAADPASLIDPLRAAVRQVDSQARATRISTMDDLLAQSIVEPRFYASLMTVFGFVALALSAVGIFGVMSYSVSQRTREIGIRMAIGATRSNVLRLVVAHGLRLTLAGVAMGLAGAFAFARFLNSLLYGISSTDPLTFVAVSLLLTLVALAACYFPVRRAMRVDPVVAIHYE